MTACLMGCLMRSHLTTNRMWVTQTHKYGYIISNNMTSKQRVSDITFSARKLITLSCVYEKQEVGDVSHPSLGWTEDVLTNRLWVTLQILLKGDFISTPFTTMAGGEWTLLCCLIIHLMYMLQLVSHILWKPVSWHLFLIPTGCKCQVT